MRILLLAALIASPVIAEVAPRPVGPDPRIRSLAYDPDEVFRLDLAMKFITHIRFAPGEAIQSVSVGDSASWQIVRLQRGDVLAIKPLIAGAASNMNVITDRRSYVFELRARWLKAGSRHHAYRVSFTYPEEEAAEARAAALAASRPKDRDYHWAGDAALRPLAVFDDGVKTTFRLPRHAPRPALFAVDAAGEEALVNTVQNADGFTADRVSARWTLRYGEEAAAIAHGAALGPVAAPASRREAPER
ncbi:type IV secretion system protein VirB9 [Albimonas donghaensis]|uniref:Type IV secretion system protein VirB9 n=1 Tax=Albimonas donghaensis TaxID=356660 RepID=A0A1H3FSI6_9RHOB|nr:TrbG/VirB9 family P-type conjugative transfer protein [Albimonas donghaensis]SDX93890.1 type IV secretion system protein VirB9 [Albimonas donghaensis]